MAISLFKRAEEEFKRQGEENGMYFQWRGHFPTSKKIRCRCQWLRLVPMEFRRLGHDKNAAAWHASTQTPCPESPALSLKISNAKDLLVYRLLCCSSKPTFVRDLPVIGALIRMLAAFCPILAASALKIRKSMDFDGN